MFEVESLPQESAPKSECASDSARSARLYRPLTDIIESDDGVELRIEMPGVSSEDVELELARRVLTIKGHVQSTKPEGFTRGYWEYGEGDYERAFTLSEDLDGSRIDAQICDGVLSVVLPRAERAKAHRIAVKAA
ncbi:MAG: Hsp20/alpha crystallin family protein [Gammaproteobacteria bacterium]|nr:Hsp20/alpha crystallin family protein [Gammaproteobacteria bacterium]